MIFHSLRCKNGFTLIEILIVVAIIGILAAIAIPRFFDTTSRAKEALTKGNISAIRSAVSIYYARNDGVWPTSLISFSEYINPLPPAKAAPLGDTNKVTVVSGVPTATGTGWAYDPNTGDVWCNSIATDSKGVSFTTY